MPRAEALLLLLMPLPPGVKGLALTCEPSTVDGELEVDLVLPPCSEVPWRGVEGDLDKMNEAAATGVGLALSWVLPPPPKEGVKGRADADRDDKPPLLVTGAWGEGLMFRGVDIWWARGGTSSVESCSFCSEISSGMRGVTAERRHSLKGVFETLDTLDVLAFARWSAPPSPPPAGVRLLEGRITGGRADALERQGG